MTDYDLLIVGGGIYGCAIAREAAEFPVPAPRRRAVTLDFGRRAARRLLGHLDPDCESLG